VSLHLERQIDRLKQMILSVGTLVEEAVQNGIRAVETRDPKLAEQVIQGDSKIDLVEIDVEEECLHTLALHQPVAFHLRFVVAVLKMNNDLERMGDLAVNIAEQAQFLCDMPPLNQLPYDLTEYSRLVQTMVKSSLDAMVNSDAALAQTVRMQDKEVDEMHRRTYERVAELIQQAPSRTEALIHMLSVSRQLERIADHAVNVAEDVIYMVQGTILRHSSKTHPTQRQTRA